MEHEGSTCKTTASSTVNQTEAHNKLKGLIFSHMVKDSRNRPGVAQRVPGGLGS